MRHFGGFGAEGFHEELEVFARSNPASTIGPASDRQALTRAWLGSLRQKAHFPPGRKTKSLQV
jgi:hypothetical protein